MNRGDKVVGRERQKAAQEETNPALEAPPKVCPESATPERPVEFRYTFRFKARTLRGKKNVGHARLKTVWKTAVGHRRRKLP